MEQRIVILGGGPAGYEAALVAAEQGADVIVVSREGLGGNSVLWDCVPSKAMIVSSVAMGSLEIADRLGVRLGEPVGRVTADVAAVMDRVETLGQSQSADIERNVLDTGAKILRGEGHLTGPETVSVTTDEGVVELSADTILVATGSRPRELPFSKPDGERVFTSRELFNLRTSPERLIVIGSGVTGAEYAQAFAKLGIDVHLVSSRDVIMPSEDPDAAALLEEEFERWGVTIHRRRRAYDMVRSTDGVRVKIADKEGNDETWIEGSHALYCVGMVPVSDGIGLENAGVAVTPWGAIDVDDVSRTNVRSIYAAGDVTGKIMLASVAAMQGRIAMYHSLGLPVTPLNWDAVASCVFTSPQVASVGLTEHKIDGYFAPVEVIRLPFFRNPRAKMEEATTGFVKILAQHGSGTVVGATMVAPNASDLVTPLSVAVQNRLTVGQLASAFSIYPSMSGSTIEVARQLWAAQRGTTSTS